MKKVHIFCAIAIFLLSFSQSCKKQEPVKTDIQYIMPEDTVVSRAKEAIYSDPLLSRKILKEEMEKRAVSDSANWYILYDLYVKTFLTNDELDSVIPLSRKIEQFCARQYRLEPIHYYLLANVNNNIGTRYSISSMNDSALRYFEKVVELSPHVHNSRITLTAYTNLANIYVLNGFYDQGAYYYHRMLYMADSLNIPQAELINVYTGLGQTYMELRDFDLSHHYYGIAGRFIDLMDINRQFVYYNAHGNVYYFEGKYQEALELFKKGYALNNEYARNTCMVNMAEVYLLTGRLDSAGICLDRSRTYFESIRNTSVLFHIQTLLFELNLRKKNLPEANRLLQSLTDSPYAGPTLVGIRKKYLQHYYEATGDYRKAYECLKENIRMDDSIRNDRIRMRVAEKELRYKQDTTLMKQRLFIQQQQSDMYALKMVFLIWSLLFVILTIVTVFVYFYQKKKRAYLLTETRNKIINLRLENIRNRISPHFFFNTLNRVIVHYDENDSNYKELCNLVKITRLNLCLAEKLCISLAEEIDFVRTYLIFEQQRYGSSLHTEIEIDPLIDADRLEILSMMIQIPVENAIKHGLRDKEGEKRLAVTVIRSSGYFIIRIEDNGTGFHLQTGRPDSESTGTGLKVLNQSIELLNAINPVPLTLTIANNENGTEDYPGCVVQFNLPEGYSYAFPKGK